MRRLAAAVALLLAVAACSGDGPGAGSEGTPAEAPSTTVTPATTEATAATTTSEGTGDAVEVTGLADGACWAFPAAAGTDGIGFEDVTAAWGLVDPLTGMHAHAAAWGDVDGDLNPDLFVGTFATARPEVYQVRGATGPAPDRLLIGGGAGGFTPSGSFPEAYGRTSGAAFVDLDNDGDDDLVLSRNASPRGGEAAVTEVLENTGDGFVPTDGGFDPALGGRSVGVLDVDEDGLLDLLVVEDRYRGGSSRLYRNLGDLRFEDATATHFVADVHGLGIATADLNHDRHTDVFVAGSNRLFVGDGATLTEVAADELGWESFGAEDDVAGAAVADVNRDGWLDLAVGHHYNSTLSQGNRVPVRLYLNRTTAAGEAPVFEDVTDAAGLVGTPTKAPHVELADLDNDGWPDLLTSASAGDGTGPAVFRHTGLVDGIPRFAAPEGMGAAQYWVAAPTMDVDRDGRLDTLLVEWEPSLPSLMLRNTSASGHWLGVSIEAALGGGVGTRIDVYRAGQAGDAAALLGSREIVASLGYTAGVARVAHFGLGEVTEVDVVVTPPLPHQPLTLTVAADRHLHLPGGCG